MPADMKATAPEDIFGDREMAALMCHDWLQSSDITERKQVEAELRQNNAILNAINKSAPTPIFVPYIMESGQTQVVELTFASAAALETVRLAAEAKLIDLQFTILDFGLDDVDGSPKSTDADEQLSHLKSKIQNPKFQVFGDVACLQQVVAIASWFQSHMTKPVKPQVLVKAIVQLCGQGEGTGT
ncbi:hypothetical protein [Gloeocapsopsis sp. IPPAS B-1203]|uniref:hypothetical protein n=1 Tax=Gloeocapsopsis sp. IPPAS B-1203 TaxID=2049454 RepID=UPI000C1A7F9E|nr:hypothetical protein [Gloeocapsopsis sp. IPPAS B-1203]PIG93946.1 hypothetical protein CSQ79_06190 [Gloeocapsopsis sp. IPPAS B-1203]